MPAADGKPKIKVGEGKGNTQHKLPQLNQTRTKPQWSLTNPPFTLLGDMPNIQQKNVDNTQSNSHKLTGTMKKAMRLTHKEVRERFRKTLVDIIFGHNNQLNNQSEPSDSLIGEIELTKYNYYITHGVETEDVAPLEDHWLGNMFSLVDNSLKHHAVLVEDLSNEVRDDYLLSVKKASSEPIV